MTAQAFSGQCRTRQHRLRTHTGIPGGGPARKKQMITPYQQPQPERFAMAGKTRRAIYLGALFGFVADRLGRRIIFMGSLLWYAAASLVMAFQQDALR